MLRRGGCVAHRFDIRPVKRDTSFDRDRRVGPDRLRQARCRENNPVRDSLESFVLLNGLDQLVTSERFQFWPGPFREFLRLGQQFCLIGIDSRWEISLSGIVAAIGKAPYCPPSRTVHVRPTREDHARCALPAADAASPRKRNATAKAAEGNLGGFCVCSDCVLLPRQSGSATRSFLTNAVFDQFLSDRSGSKYGLRSIVLYDVLPICDRRGCSN